MEYMAQKGAAMENIIVIAVLLIIIGAAIWYICKEKKKGNRCIGCPAAGSCQGHCANSKADKKNPH